MAPRLVAVGSLAAAAGSSYGRTWFAAAVLLAGAVVLVAGASQPVFLRLEPRQNNSSELMNMDQLRLTSRGLMIGGVVNLPVIGKGDEYLAGGPYLTRVQLGNPPKNFNVIIDTGSSMPWVSCQTPGGPSVSTLPGLFDPRSSSSSSLIACSDKRCQGMVSDMLAVCTDSSDTCGLSLSYGPGADIFARTTGYYVYDIVHLDIIDSLGRTSSAPATIMFGCSTSRSGDLATAMFDGIFSFSPYQLSFSSQLHYQGLSPRVFTLCLRSLNGGGILVFGEALQGGIVYTPLLPSPNIFQLYLETIAVNGQKLHIEPSVFRPSKGHLTIADSGTSWAYLADKAYDPFIDAIVAAMSPSVRQVVKNSDRCFFTSNSVDLSFPTLTLYFVGGAVMNLKPKNYLFLEDQVVYCIAWKRNHGKQVTILGDIVLMDKLLIHDLKKMVFGWVDFDCSQSINVTRSIRKKHVNSGNVSFEIWTVTRVVIILAHIFTVFAISAAS